MEFSEIVWYGVLGNLMGVPVKFPKTPYHEISENAIWGGVGTRRPTYWGGGGGWRGRQPPHVNPGGSGGAQLRLFALPGQYVEMLGRVR